jgi:hypothetical protein
MQILVYYILLERIEERLNQPPPSLPLRTTHIFHNVQMDARSTTNSTGNSADVNLSTATRVETRVGLGTRYRPAEDSFPAIPRENFTDSVKRQVFLLPST